ncbi:fructokinase [Sphingomonas zeicaulis]|uniref:ROK family protein n=1 Tax=Sphingomonas zeicaulis TaxID=1632740 RepID=UPI003D1DDC22
MSNDDLFAAVEAGGTKFICAFVGRQGHVLEQITLPTLTPGETFAAVASFFEAAALRHGRPAAAGLASFGPIELDPSASSFGRILKTPKAGWDGADIRGALAAATRAPVAIDTDVNAAALGENLQGAARDVRNFAYVTVGTGIGVGIMLNGQVRSPFPHTEIGHIRVPRAPGDLFVGACPFHGDCLEGLASGPSMHLRWKQGAETLETDHPGWAYTSHYIASLCVNLTYALRLERIVLGGGVMSAPSLLARIREDFMRLMGGYAIGRHAADPETFLVAPVLVDPSPGLVGAIEMARIAAAKAFH